jgi:tRNA A37 threonylcarbamoyladenosine synthetase subunit TsaC/SUA5/YrdC
MSEIIKIKKLKKDGTIEEDTQAEIIKHLKADKLMLMPIDGIYGVVAVWNDKNLKRIEALPYYTNDSICLISNFSMLEKHAEISKKDYDFLHRIWPDQVVVILKKKYARSNHELKYIKIQMPRSQFLHDIIDGVEDPLLYINVLKPNKKPYCKKKELKEMFAETTDIMVIIDEWCKSHLMSTLIDIRNNELHVLHEGKVAIDEIKSLYFLGADDIFY